MARNYTIYFEAFGRKMKTVVLAENREEAKQKLLEKVVIHDMTCDKKDYFNKAMEFMDDIIDTLGKMKP
jgi:hypothetical protein